MKKSELTRIIKEEIQRVLRESDSDTVVSGFELANAYSSGDWSDIEAMLEDEPGGRKILSTLKNNVRVVEVDLDEASDPEMELDGMIETSTPIAELAKVNPKWAKEWAAKGYKYFSFIPVDYNRGTNNINLGVSKVPNVLEMIVGDY